jgi:16S rRNA G966 N2-methylase RsmD
MPNYDLFGVEIIKDVLLRDKFIEPPFTVINTTSGHWQQRRKAWISRGILSEVGRDIKGQKTSLRAGDADYLRNGKTDKSDYVSVFDPALCEVLYHWFCPDGGKILDPFAGGSVRGIVANYLSYKYTGIDIRQEQIESNREQALSILPVNNQPQWYVGNSNDLLDGFAEKFDFVFSCPPYADLEVYSNLVGDISNQPYKEFIISYESIISKACKLLKPNCLSCFVVGEVRDKNGFYYGFVPDTIKAFERCGLRLYNEAILLNAIASASMRAAGNMKSKKLVKVHQNVLVFYKP